MHEEIKLKQGILIFTENHIQIKDNIKRIKQSYNIMAVVWSVLGILGILNFIKNGSFYQLVLGVISIVVWIIVLMKNIKLNTDIEIPVSSIEKVMVKKNLTNDIQAIIYIRDRKKRTVLLSPYRKNVTEEFEKAVKINNIKFELQIKSKGQ